MWDILLNATQDSQAQKFIRKVKAQCMKSGVDLKVSTGPRISMDEWQVGGFFDYIADRPVLGIAIGRPFNVWFATFVHETSHMDQFFENDEVWQAYVKEEFDYYTYLDGKGPTTKRLRQKYEQAIDTTVLMEADCEIRSMAKIVKQKLPLDMKEYAKQANAYLLFYSWMKLKHKWSVRSPYEVPEILAQMPTDLLELDCYTQPLDPSLIEAFDLTQLPLESIT